MDKIVEKSLDNHCKKYNCCQAVACAFSDKIGLSEDVLFKVGEGFGLGMGCMEGTCGAISGAIMLAGFKNSDGNMESPATKADTYSLSREIVKRFQEKNGATRCKDLKGIETGKILRSCDGCIEDAASIAEEVLFQDK